MFDTRKKNGFCDEDFIRLFRVFLIYFVTQQKLIIESLSTIFCFKLILERPPRDRIWASRVNIIKHPYNRTYIYFTDSWNKRNSIEGS